MRPFAIACVLVLSAVSVPSRARAQGPVDSLSEKLAPQVRACLGNAPGAAQAPRRVAVFPLRLDHEQDAGGELSELVPRIAWNRAGRVVTELVIAAVQEALPSGEVLGPEELLPLLARKRLEAGHFRGAAEAGRFGEACGADQVVFGTFHRERRGATPDLVVSLVVARPGAGARPRTLRVPLRSYGGNRFCDDAVTRDYDAWESSEVPRESALELWGQDAATILRTSGVVGAGPRFLVLASEGTNRRTTALAERARTSICEGFAAQGISFVQEPHDALREAGYEVADVLRLLDRVAAASDRAALESICADAGATALVHVTLDPKPGGVVMTSCECFLPGVPGSGGRGAPHMLGKLLAKDVGELVGKAPESAAPTVSGDAALLAALRQAARGLCEEIGARPELEKRVSEGKTALGPILTKELEGARLLLADLAETHARELATRTKLVRARLGDGARLEEVVRQALAEPCPVSWNGTVFPNLLSLAAFRARATLDLVLQTSPAESARKSALRTALLGACKVKGPAAALRSDNLLLDAVVASACDSKRLAALEQVTTFGTAPSVDPSTLIADVLVADLLLVFRIDLLSENEIVARALLVEVTTQKCLAEATARVFARHSAAAAAALGGAAWKRPVPALVPPSPPLVPGGPGARFGAEQRRFVEARVPMIYAIWRRGAEPTMASGSGFALRIAGTSRIVTNRHVVVEAGGSASELYLAFPSGEFFATRLVEWSPSCDLAVLEDPRKEPHCFEVAPAVLDAKVRLAGYPGLVSRAAVAARWSEAPRSCRDLMDPFVMIVTEGTVLRLGEPVQGASRRHRVITDIASWAGNSGGPLLDEELRVVAVHYAGSTVELRQSDRTVQGHDQSKLAYGILLGEHLGVLEALSAGRKE